MEKTGHLTELKPCYSHSTCVSTATRANGGFLYDDYAREIPVPPIPQTWQTRSSPTPTKPKSPLYVAVCLALVIFVSQLGASLTNVPTVRLLEGILCQQMYDASSGVSLPETECQGADVQAELNILSLGALILGYLPGAFVAIPYGILSDRFGRKAVLALSVFGMVMSQLIWAVVAWNWRRWKLRYTWTSSAALLVGGGESVAQSMVFAMIADVAPQSKRATTYFTVQICAIMLAQAIAPFIAAPMMAYSLWLPLLAAPDIVSLGGLLIPIVPDTLQIRRCQETASMNNSPPPDPEFLGPLPRRASSFDPWATPWSRIRDNAQATLRLLQTRDVKLLLPCASLVVPIATVAMNILLRLLPVRFDWTIAHTGMLLGACTGLNLLLIAAAASLLLSRLLFPPRARRAQCYLSAAKISMLLLVAGSLVIGSATTVGIVAVGLSVMTLGAGAPALCRAILVRLAADQGHSVGQVFGVLAVCEAVGYIVCCVGFGALYQWCLSLAGEGSTTGSATAEVVNPWLSFVLFVAATILFGCGGMVGVVDAKSIVGRRGEEEGAAAAEGDGVANVSRRSVSPPPLAEEGREDWHELRMLADARLTRTGSCLENGYLAAFIKKAGI